MPPKRTMIRRFCERCGQEFFVTHAALAQRPCRYCSRSCLLATSPEERFWSKVDQTGSCWLWTAATDRSGYGVFGVTSTDIRFAHRYAWEVTHGPIPGSAVVCHHCDNPPCVNPEHLFLGSTQDNMADKVTKGRHRGIVRMVGSLFAPKPAMITTCEHCGNTFAVTASTATQRYCSAACRGMARRQPVHVRFWQFVEKTDGCWPWAGLRTKQGYGRINDDDNERQLIASRVSWEIHYGPIPDGLQVCHHCDNPPCVNPEHLFLGTAADNAHDKMAKGRQNRGETHGMVKLTWDDVRRIRHLYQTRQRTQTELAREYDLSQSQVQRIVTGESWSHLDSDD